MIRIENLIKDFGPKRVVSDISFNVERGEVVGFLGPNGAGKSTTMRMITGFIPPTSGRVTVGSHDIVEDPIAAKRLIGYLPENAASYPDMSVHGFLNFAAALRGLSGDQKKRAIGRAVDMCMLDAVLFQSIDTLSKGYRHRTCLAQSLIHDPDVLVLDEPTDGLDPNQKHEVRNLIRELGKTKAVVFSTHILEEVDASCTRAVIIDRGRIVANGNPQQLRAMSPLSGAVTLQLGAQDMERAEARLASLPGVARVERLQDRVRVYPSEKRADGSASGELARAVADLAGREGWSLIGLRTEEGHLDEVFRSITLPDTHKAGAGGRS